MIRRDLWAVKEKGNGFDQWTYIGVFRSLLSAKRFKKMNGPILGFSYQSALVHPDQRVVDAFVVAGNEIKD